MNINSAEAARKLAIAVKECHAHSMHDGGEPKPRLKPSDWVRINSLGSPYDGQVMMVVIVAYQYMDSYHTGWHYYLHNPEDATFTMHHPCHGWRSADLELIEA